MSSKATHIIVNEYMSSKTTHIIVNENAGLSAHGEAFCATKWMEIIAVYTFWESHPSTLRIKKLERYSWELRYVNLLF